VVALAGCGSSAGAAAPGSAAPSGSPASAVPSGSPGKSGQTGAHLIVIQMFAFHPASLTVAPGTTIRVRNSDTTAHTLTDKADPKLFNTGDIAPGQTKTFTAPAKPGSYPYICLIHQFMTGTLVVR
jgi:plastocyanin